MPITDTRAAVAVIVQKPDRTVLIGKRLSEKYYGRWGLPGGWVEAGETAHEAAQRELSEEAAIVVDRLNVFGVYGQWSDTSRGFSWTGVDPWVIIPTFRVEVAQQCQARVAEPEKCERWEWVSVDRVCSMLTSEVMPATVKAIQDLRSMQIEEDDAKPVTSALRAQITPMKSITALRHDTIIAALRSTSTVMEAVRALGIGRATLYRFIRDHKIDVKSLRSRRLT